MEIKNIYCVGRNYVNHALELKNEVPDKPMIFTKPTHALANADGGILSFPMDDGQIHYEAELVLYVGEDIAPGFKVDDVITKIALGVDFTLRDVQSELKKKGHPWLLAKGFKNAAVLTDFWDFPGTNVCEETTFSLQKNDQMVQQGKSKSMIFNFQVILEYIHQHIGLGKGDIIYTGTPEGVGPITDQDQFTLKWGTGEKGSFTVSK